MKTLLFSLLIPLFLLAGCLYQMPAQDNVCILPHTNNPNITREKVGGLPGKG